jgi:hypothetical protein
MVKDDYFRFYFWLDTMATLSLISDIGWIWDRILGNKDFSASNAQQASQLARAGRGARVGTRASRVIRIIRLIRLIRVVKLYKHAHYALADNTEKHKNEDQKSELNPENQSNLEENMGRSSQHPDQELDHQRSIISQSEARSHTKLERVHTVENAKTNNNEDEMIPEESRVGKKLSDLTTKRVIILVLAMMFSVPIFSMSTYRDENDSFDFGLAVINFFSADPEGVQFQTAYETYLNEHINIRTPVISLYVEIDDFTQSWDADDISPDDLRYIEADIAAINDGNFVAIFDLRKNVQLMSGLAIGRTLFVCLVLASGAMVFSKDANDLVIAPIEQMIHKVNRIARNPLEAAQEEENEALALEQAKYEDNKSKKKKKKKEEPYETVILEQTIVKIGALLALGFGEAGAKIIADNMAHTGDVDPMIPGTKVLAIFGFCDIRQFAEITEVLQEDIMLFVNEIAEIIHSIVDQFSVTANK